MKKNNFNKKSIHITQIIILITLIIILSSNTIGIKISEIMYNPNGADTSREWIEIEFNESDGCINLTEYKLFEENTNHNIYATNFSDHNVNDNSSCEYAIISNDVNKFLLDYTHLNKSFRIYKSVFSLINTGEEIALKQNDVFIDYIDYTPILLQISVAEGYSLTLENDVWKSSEVINGTPGNTNIIVNISTEIIYYNITVTENTTLINYTETNNTEINLTINITNNKTDNNYTYAYDTTNNITNNTTTSAQNVCSLSLYILIKNESVLYENNVPIKFSNKIMYSNISNMPSNINYSIEYWIEDLLGNIVKSKVVTTNQDEKSFTPKIDESDKILFIKNSLKYSNQTECTLINNSSEKMLLIKNSNYVSYVCPKLQSCPTCDCKVAKTTSPEYNSENIINLCNQKPLIKTVNVCNNSIVASNNANNITNISQNIKLKSTALDNSILNSSNKTQNAGLTTGMIVYESPNLKNRLYALIGLILVGLTCVGMIFYNFLKRKADAKDIN